MGWRLWATGRDLPCVTCEDARLRRPNEEDGEILYGWEDTTYGQGGWDIGVMFSTLSDLAQKLENGIKVPGEEDRLVQPGEVERLAIHVHGEPGIAYVNGQRSDPYSEDVLRVENLDYFGSDLLMINDYLTNDAFLIFMCCRTGQGDAGTEFIGLLSMIHAPRRVVAIATTGYCEGGSMKRVGAGGANPGMRDTDKLDGWPDPFHSNPDLARIWDDLDKLPWAGPTSPHAKVAWQGSITRGKNL